MLLTVSVKGTEGPLEMVRGVLSTTASCSLPAGSALPCLLQGIGNISSNLTADQRTLSDLKAENEQLRSHVERRDKISPRSVCRVFDPQNTYNLQSTGAVLSLVLLTRSHHRDRQGNPRLGWLLLRLLLIAVALSARLLSAVLQPLPFVLSPTRRAVWLRGQK